MIVDDFTWWGSFLPLTYNVKQARCGGGANAFKFMRGACGVIIEHEGGVPTLPFSQSYDGPNNEILTLYVFASRLAIEVHDISHYLTVKQCLILPSCG